MVMCHQQGGVNGISLITSKIVLNVVIILSFRFKIIILGVKIDYRSTIKYESKEIGYTAFEDTGNNSNTLFRQYLALRSPNFVHVVLCEQPDFGAPCLR